MEKSVNFVTALGPCSLLWTDKGVSGLRLFEAPRKSDMASAPPAWVKKAIKEVQKHLEDGATDLSEIPLDLGPTGPFFKRVYEKARRIPAGQTRSYAEVAAAAGSARASRAVGQAMARNRIPLIIPCHRVMGAGGRLTGFSAPGGVGTKAALLALEGAAV